MTEIDLLIRDINERPITLVEVKIHRSALSGENVKEIFNRLKSYNSNLGNPAQYFLLVSPEIGFLWKQPYQTYKPTLEFSMKEVITRYLPEKEARENIRYNQLELIILEWLTDLAWISTDPMEEPEKSLAAHGFLQAIKEASVLPRARAV